MAMMWDFPIVSCCWIALASFLMTLALMQPAYTNPASVSCTDIHGDAFGNESVKPGVCYLVSEEEGVFLDARAFCQGLNDRLGWDVADIEDAEENNLIQDALKDSGSFSGANKFWIGQTDMKTENVWRYLNDSSNKCNRTVYLNWESGQPNGGRRQNCVILIGGTFQDRRCDASHNYLCKVQITQETVPSCPDFIEDTSTEAPDECLDVLPDAFSNPSVPGVCYASKNSETTSFQEALSYCESLSGGNWSLADIEGSDENMFLEVWNRDTFPKNDGYWIGQNDREQEGDYRYTSSGQCPVYLNWRNNQPNGDRQQNCIVMFKRDDGQFQDKDCSKRTYFTLCKLKMDPGRTQDPPTSCDNSTTPPEVAVCSILHANAFGSVDNPGVCYFMTGLKLNWELAIDFCQGQGWSLIDIEDATENEILAARHRDFKPLEQKYWVGQNDMEIEGAWKYSSNDTPSDAGVFLNWLSGQPNDDGHSQNCIMMDNSGIWQDKACSNAYYVTCKMRIATTTAASCSGHSPRRFVFLTSDATCHPLFTLTPISHATSRVQCARDCLLHDKCRSFSFATSGKEDACELCSQVLDVQYLPFKPGSLYYELS